MRVPWSSLFGGGPDGGGPGGGSPRGGGRAVACLVAICVVTAVLGGEAAGCPNCKDGVNVSDPEGLNLARGYFYSILLMLAMPFTLAGSFGCYVWREMRRQEREQAAEPGERPVGS